VYVKATYDKLIPGFFGAPNTLQARTVMRLEPFVGEGICEGS